jgi:hypothetical protein
MSSVLGPHVTGMLDGTGTEADPGISSLILSNAVRNAAASCQARKRVTRQTCGPVASAVKQPPVARDAKEWHRLRADVEITSLLKAEVFAERSAFAPLSAVLNNTRQTNSGTQLLYPYVRYLPNASKKHFLTARPKGPRGPGGRWQNAIRGFGFRGGGGLYVRPRQAPGKKVCSIFDIRHPGLWFSVNNFRGGGGGGLHARPRSPKAPGRNRGGPLSSAFLRGLELVPARPRLSTEQRAASSELTQ